MSEVVLRHPNDARVTTSQPAARDAANYELWISDGEIVRTYSGAHKLGTERPVRRAVVGVSGRTSRDLPGTSPGLRPAHRPADGDPAGDVRPSRRATARTSSRRVTAGSSASTRSAGREAIVVECVHPRTIEMAADRPDFRIRVAVDRADGVILRLEESIGGVSRPATPG